MTSKSITLHASTGLLPSYGRVAVQGESQTAWDSVHLGDLSTKHVATNGQGMPYHGGCRCPLRVGEIERDGPNPMRSQQSRKTRLFGRTLRDLFCSLFKSLAWASEANRIGIRDAKSQRVRYCRRSNTHSKLISTFQVCIESP